MEKLSPWPVDALVGVSAEEVSLRLQQVRRQADRVHRSEQLQRRVCQRSGRSRIPTERKPLITAVVDPIRTLAYSAAIDPGGFVRDVILRRTMSM